MNRTGIRASVRWSGAVVAAALLAAAGVSAWADEHRWIDGEGEWSVGANWTPAGPPTWGGQYQDTAIVEGNDPQGDIVWVDGPDEAYLTQISGAKLIVNGGFNTGVLETQPGTFGSGWVEHQGGVATVGLLLLNGGQNDAGVYRLVGGSLLSGGQYIGWTGGYGIFAQSAQTINTVGNLVIGAGGGIGEYQLEGGTLVVQGLPWYAGEVLGNNGGVGQMTQTGGIHLVEGSLLVGNSWTGSTFDLLAGDLSVTQTTIIGEYNVATAGMGIFNQGAENGAPDFATGGLRLGTSAGDLGTYNLVSGSLTVQGNTMIGDGGTGYFTQTGGSHSVGQSLCLAEDPQSQGTYDMQGGTLSVAGMQIAYQGQGWFYQGTGTTITNSGDALLGDDTGSGVFVQTGGTHTITGTLNLGSTYSTGSGSYTISAGASLTAGRIVVGPVGPGTFVQNGGDVDAGIDLTVANGSYTLSGGTLQATLGHITYPGGTFTQTGGTHTITDTLYLLGGGTYTLSAGTLNVGDIIVGSQGTGTFTYSGGTLNKTGAMILGDAAGSSGTFNMQASGTFTDPVIYVGNYGSGTFNHTAGTVRVPYTAGITDSGILYLGRYAGSTGAYNMTDSATQLSTRFTYVGYNGVGTFTHSAGTHAVTYTLNVGT